MNHCCSAHIISSLWKKKKKENTQKNYPQSGNTLLFHLPHLYFQGVASCSLQADKSKSIYFSCLGLFWLPSLVSSPAPKQLSGVHCRKKLKTFCFTLLVKIFFCCNFHLAIFLAKHPFCSSTANAMPRATSLAVVRLQKLSESNFSSCLCFVTESFLPQEYPRSPLPSDGFYHQGSSSAHCLHLCCQTRESWCLSPVGIRFLLFLFLFFFRGAL